jgi:glutamate--cysteine ligase
MGPLGYQSSAQAGLHISYNSLDQYAASMVEALTQEYPAYARYGVLKNGEYQQLSTSVLQIENEFYGTIRPKRRTEPGERPVTALRNRGVEYVEVRCLDLNPFLAVGIDREQMLFIDTFLLACLLVDSAPDSQRQSERLVANQIDVVERGREPGLTLRDGPNQTRVMTEWAHALLSVCDDIAEIMDDRRGNANIAAPWRINGTKSTMPRSPHRHEF